MVCLHINKKAHVACNLSFVVKNEVLKVTGSHVHFKSGSILKTVLGKDVETIVHKQEVIYVIVRPFNSSNCDELGCMSRSFIDCKLFSILTSALCSPSAIPSAIAELLVLHRHHLHFNGLLARAARCNIYISRLCYDVSVRLSVTEVHWRIIANLGFKFRSQFTTHCGLGACGREGWDHRREEWRDHLALC